MIVFADNHIRY